jgi:hypothetical protein
MCENEKKWVVCVNPGCGFESEDFSAEEIESIAENQCPQCEKFSLELRKVSGGASVR